jgi:hypothetical protein
MLLDFLIYFNPSFVLFLFKKKATVRGLSEQMGDRAAIERQGSQQSVFMLYPMNFGWSYLNLTTKEDRSSCLCWQYNFIIRSKGTWRILHSLLTRINLNHQRAADVLSGCRVWELVSH